MKSNAAKDHNQFAKSLRKNQTDAERKLWYFLRNRRLSGYKFRRQHPVGPFIADFCCPERKLVIEIDGGQHALQRKKDQSRDAWLDAEGFRVLRFWDNDVLKNIDAVLGAIADYLTSPHPGPLPEGEGNLFFPSSPLGERGEIQTASRREQGTDLYSSEPLRKKLQAGFTFFEIMVTVVLASIMMTAAFYFFEDFTRAWNQDISDLELQRQGNYALMVMEASIRQCDRFTISDYGGGTDNRITVTLPDPSGSTRAIDYYQNGTAIEENDVKAGQTTIIIPDTHVQGVEVTALTFADELVTGQPGLSVRIDLALQDASGQTAAFTASVRLRNQDVE